MDIPTDRRELMQARFQQAIGGPMLGLAIAFVVILALPYIATLNDSTLAALDAVGWMIWAAFAVELAVNTYLAPRRLRYLRDHWIDVAIVVLPFLRLLRVARAARALRLVTLLGRAATTARAILRTHGLQNVLVAGLVLVLVSAAATTFFERGSGGTIASYPDALWWAATTITTVGYGDTFPVTGAGRGVGVFLMVLGISLFGTITASVAAFFVKADDTVTTNELLAEIRELQTKVDALGAAERNTTDG